MLDAGAVREGEGGVRGWSCVFRGPEDGRRVFVVMEVAPRRLDSGGDSGGKRTESGKNALCEPFSGVGVEGIFYSSG